MPQFKCYPVTDPNANWNYCPSFPAAILFSVLFGFATVAHIVLAVLHKKVFAVVVIMGAAWECAGYIFRILSVMHQLNSGVATAQLLLILLAPLWINAFVYMVLGRAVHFFLDEDRVFRVKARRITLMFVLFDISAFVVQAAGGVMTSNTNPVKTQRLGLHIYMGGVGLQLLYICVFIALAARFQHKITLLMDPQQQSANFVNRLFSRFHKASNGMSVECAAAPQEQSRTFPEHSNETDYKSPKRAVHLLYLVYSVLLLIIFRNIYRLIEFSQGVLSNITIHEWYTYVFDAVPMLFALIILACFHPGRLLRGPRCDFSEENRAKKEATKEKKRANRRARDDKNREKLMMKVQRKEEKEQRKG